MNSDLLTFLKGFRPDGHTTFVGIVPDGSTVAETFNGTDPSQAVKWIEAQNRARGIYFTVNPTPAGLREKPKKGDIGEIAAVWADIDPLDANGRPWSEERERLIALAAELHALETPPTFIVDSGNGIQPVWLLSDPIEVNDEYRQAAESLCSQIELALGAKGTHNIDRLLRVPGTRNLPNAKKRALGRGEAQSCLLRWTWRRYSWTELERLAERLRCSPPRHAVPCEPARHRTPLGDVTLPDDAPEPLEPDRLEALRAEHPDAFDLVRYDGDQSRQDLALASLARRLGWSQQDAWRLIIAVRGDQKAYRQDYIEKTLARAYAEQTTADPVETKGDALLDLSHDGLALGMGRQWQHEARHKLKSLTGGDPITARFMRQDFFTYEPQFTLWVAGNHKPSFKGVDEAIRRRVVLVPFLQVIAAAERDPDLPEKLKAERPAILRWGIDGCLAWQREGLNPPASALTATKNYLDAEDTLGQWLEERCVVHHKIDWTALKHLYADWCTWCNERGQRPGTARALGKALDERGFSREKRTPGAGFCGIGLAHPPSNDGYDGNPANTRMGARAGAQEHGAHYAGNRHNRHRVDLDDDDEPDPADLEFYE